jgi:hypothetical protein
MSNISVAHHDFAEFEAQFATPVAPELTHSQLRVRGWVIALVASVVLWAGIAVAIAAAVHALA